MHTPDCQVYTQADTTMDLLIILSQKKKDLLIIG